MMAECQTPTQNDNEGYAAAAAPSVAGVADGYANKSVNVSVSSDNKSVNVAVTIGKNANPKRLD
jgi:hypothetical protein